MDALNLTSELNVADPGRLLAKAKLNATLLLIAPLAMFFGSFFVFPGLLERCLRAVGEAGAVGGLADWFAVVALFRRPLGLPIPHTALIPRKKDSIGLAIGRFVERNFLDTANLVAELRKEDRAAQVGAWLASPENHDIVARSIASTLHKAGRKGMHLDVVSALVPLARNVRKAVGADMEEFVAKLTGRLIPGAIDRFFSRKIGHEIDRLLDRLDTADSSERQNLDAWVRVKLEQMPATWRPLAHRFARQVETLEVLSRLGTGEPSRELIDSLAALISMLGTSLQQSDDVRRALNKALEDALVQYIAPFGAQISAYISRVVSNWSAERVTQAFELQIGKDLQFIRVNGTLVGMTAGLALFAIGELLMRAGAVG